jgi:adenylate cyclase, class 2
MLEIEMKFPVRDFAAVEKSLRERGARSPEVLKESDHYFNAPDRDFARTDEALRIRRIGPSGFVTYKGPRRDRQTKTRTEIEVPLAEGPEPAAAFQQLLQHLGYRPVSVVRKDRRIFHLDCPPFRVQACLDEVADLGSFVELEIVAEEQQLEQARTTLLGLAEKLGLKDFERRSYLELLLARQGAKTG